MIKLPFEQLRELEKSQRCGICQGELQVVWHQAENCHTLLCSSDHYPDTLVRNPTLSELYHQGKLAEGPVTNNIKRREVKKHMSERRDTVPEEFRLVRQTDLGSGQFLLPEQLRSLVEYAKHYRLDAYRGHVVLMYGQPYIGLDGYLFHASREDPGYQLQSWPMTANEKTQYMVGDYDHAWIAEVYRSGNPHPFAGIGIVTSGEMTEISKKTPGQLRYPIVASKPWVMAQKRAEWQALRRAFPIGDAAPGEED